MTQRIAQEHAISIAQKVGCSVRGHYDETGATPQEIERLCNAAIQHYIDQQAKELPELPEPCLKGIGWSQGYFDKAQLQAYGQQCAAHAREVALSEAMEQCMYADCYESNGAAILAHDYIRALKKAGK